MSADGHEFFRAANGVWLTGHVPPVFISFADRPPAASPSSPPPEHG